MKRILTAVVLIPVVVWVILFAPFEAFRIALLIVGALAYFEFLKIAGISGTAHVSLGIAAGAAVLYAREPGTILVLAALVGIGLALRERDRKNTLPTAGAFVLGVVYIFGAWRCAAELRTIQPHWLMFAMLLSWAGDTVALYVGKAFGRNKMAPRVSPAKTWEGAAGSVIGSVAGGILYAHFLIPAASVPQVLCLAVVGNIAGQIGDLCESAFKRGAGVKDSGTLLPGHGGWLDRIDSSLFAVPAVYVLVLYAAPVWPALP